MTHHEPLEPQKQALVWTPIDTHRITAEPGYIIRMDRGRKGLFCTGWLPLRMGPVPGADGYDLDRVKAVCQQHYDRITSGQPQRDLIYP